jgi:hypothetical protein
MRISSATAMPYGGITQTRQTEQAERGPDRDRDGDETTSASATQKLSKPPAGRGSKIDILA